MFGKIKYWNLPPPIFGGEGDFLRRMAEQEHIMIAGATGSGKSVLLNDFTVSLLDKSPSSVLLVLIDPKRVELSPYRRLPHVIGYASEPDDIARLLREVCAWMERRYSEMERSGIRKCEHADAYIMIDEFADLITTSKRETLPTLCRIAQLGRAAKIHLVLCTQRPTREILCGQIAVNITCKVALRCQTPQDSRNIIRINGAELLPMHGYGLLQTPQTRAPEIVEIPFLPDEKITERVNYWLSEQKRIHFRQNKL